MEGDEAEQKPLDNFQSEITRQKQRKMIYTYDKRRHTREI